MGYLKIGIVTRIEIIKNKELSQNYIKQNFNLNLFNPNEKTYLLKPEVLKKNLTDYRQELMELSEGECDSLDNCEAYCLEINVNKMLENEIYLTEDNKKFYFANYENMNFETDVCTYKTKKMTLKIFFIPVFWDVNWVTFENLNNITTIVNNLTRKAMKNILKDASWFTII